MSFLKVCGRLFKNPFRHTHLITKQDIKNVAKAGINIYEYVAIKMQERKMK